MLPASNGSNPRRHASMCLGPAMPQEAKLKAKQSQDAAPKTEQPKQQAPAAPAPQPAAKPSVPTQLPGLTARKPAGELAPQLLHLECMQPVTCHSVPCGSVMQPLLNSGNAWRMCRSSPEPAAACAKGGSAGGARGPWRNREAARHQGMHQCQHHSACSSCSKRSKVAQVNL